LARAKRIKIYTSTALTSELESAVLKPRVALQMQRANASADTVVAAYLRLAHVIKRPQAIRPVCQDPNSDEILACARSAHADLIVSGDKELLDLQRYETSPIVTPSVGLTIIRSTIGP
jgi:putative PIN family toxin of toxin-antitoxin system